MIKKSLTYIYILCVLIAIYSLQIFFVDSKELFGVKPNLILISIIVVSLWYGLTTGTIYSFLVGFVTDILFANSFGMFTIAYTLVGVIVALINSNYIKENKMSLVYVTLIATTCFELIQGIEYMIFFNTYGNVFYMLKQIALSSILNIVIVYIVYGLIYKIVGYFESNLKRQSSSF